MAIEDLWRLLGRLHPVIVHFPIALLLLGAAVEVVLAATRPRHRMSSTGMTCLVIAALTAALAAWFGWLNADIEPHGSAAAPFIFWHRWIGLATAIAAWVALLCGLAFRAKESDWAIAGYRGGLIIAAVAVCVTGYFGGEVTHGRGYLTSVMPWMGADADAVADANAVMDAVTDADASVAIADAHAILIEHCSHCHGPERAKGGLQLEPLAAAFAGPPEDWTIRPGAPEESRLVERVSLAADHPDLMPADGDRLTDEQIGVLVAWIEAGVDGVADPITDTDPVGVADTDADADPVAPTDVDPAARVAAMRAVIARGGSAVPVAAGSVEVDVNLSLARPPVTDDDLDLLAGLESCLVRLNLARSGVTDDGLARLADFTRLRRLRLERCAITDDGLAHLAGHETLTHLNLFGTEVGDAGLDALAEIPSLRAVYLWQTNVTEEGAERLQERRPDLDVQRGHH
ncbi:MAG: DUF2231 domain-containing protein [Planctomycetota bacterium]